jgi:hypothetical protein
MKIKQQTETRSGRYMIGNKTPEGKQILKYLN